MAAASWTDTDWQLLDARTRARALLCADAASLRRVMVRHGREVLKSFSTSFFIVTRFLPPAKRAQVDLLYAAVRYPDEVVDSFAISPQRRAYKLAQWRAQFEQALRNNDPRVSLEDGLPVILAGFAEVVREAAIPPVYYHHFLDAMQADITPCSYDTLDDLVANYIHGSAIVVGYFLAHIYGATPGNWDRAMEASRRLGIALQLTNFLRDVNEDDGRGRLYMPLDMLARHGGDMASTVRELAGIARADYDFAAANLDAFSADCQAAIGACIRVYSELNRKLAAQRQSLRRESVPMSQKFAVLPRSKYWRLPLAYLGLEIA